MTCDFRFPVIAIGVLVWVDEILSDKSYFKLNTDHTPLHLVLVDEIVTNHLLLHQKALDLLVRLFESSFDELDVLVRVSVWFCILTVLSEAGEHRSDNLRVRN